MKILIADDDAAWLHMLTRYFGAAGHEVFSASTWKAARALAESALPDLILLDSSLPDGEAGAFCAALRADRRFGGTALLLLSGDETPAGHGADGSLLKCEPLSALNAAIAAALAARAAARGGN